MSEEKKIVPTGYAKRFSNIDLSLECLPSPVFSKRTFYSDRAPVEYLFAPLVHKTRTASGKLVTDNKFLVEGPVLTSIGGIRIRKRDNKYLASCPVSHNTSDDEIKRFCGVPLSESHHIDQLSEEEKGEMGFWAELYYRCLEFIFQQRELFELKSRERLESCFAYPVGWKYTRLGQYDETRHPFKWYKLYTQGNITRPGHKKATFVIPTKANKRGQIELPWQLLQNVELRFRPVFEILGITYSANRFVINTRIVSAVVYGFTKINMVCRQEAALAEVRDNEELLEGLQFDLEDSLELNPTANTLEVDGEGKVTVEGNPELVKVAKLSGVLQPVEENTKLVRCAELGTFTERSVTIPKGDTVCSEDSDRAVDLGTSTERPPKVRGKNPKPDPICDEDYGNELP